MGGGSMSGGMGWFGNSFGGVSDFLGRPIASSSRRRRRRAAMPMSAPCWRVAIPAPAPRRRASAAWAASASVRASVRPSASAWAPINLTNAKTTGQHHRRHRQHDRRRRLADPRRRPDRRPADHAGLVAPAQPDGRARHAHATARPMPTCATAAAAGTRPAAPMAPAPTPGRQSSAAAAPRPASTRCSTSWAASEGPVEGLGPQRLRAGRPRARTGATPRSATHLVDPSGNRTARRMNEDGMMDTGAARSRSGRSCLAPSARSPPR